MDKPNYYAVIPATVRYDNELLGDEKILYGEISALASKEGHCWATNDYFAKLYGVTPKTISTWVNHLKDRHHLETEVDKQGNRKIYICQPSRQVLRGIPPSVIPPLPSSVIHNNTSINNKTNIVSDETFTFEEFMETKGYVHDSLVDSDGNEHHWWEKDGRKLKKSEETALRKEFKRRDQKPSEVDRFADAIISVMKKHHGKAPMITYAEKKRIYENLVRQLEKNELKEYAQWYFVDADLPLERRMNLYSFTDAYWVNKFRSQ